MTHPSPGLHFSQLAGTVGLRLELEKMAVTRAWGGKRLTLPGQSREGSLLGCLIRLFYPFSF